MVKKRVVMYGTLISIALSFALAACSGGVRVGDLQTKSQTVELGDADTVNVDIQMGAGDLDVSGGASELLDATFTYNVAKLNPRATYSNGRLEVKDSDVKTGIGSLFDLNGYRNEWDLSLNEDVPMEMQMDLGAGRSTLTLGALDLTGLDINGGAGDLDLDLTSSQSLRRFDLEMGVGKVTIDLTGDWQKDLDARIVGGVGGLHLRLPAEVGLRIRVATGIGNIVANGLTRDGDTFTNDAYGVSDVTLRIDIDSGVGQINLDAG